MPKPSSRSRASRADIFERLERLLGAKATPELGEIVALLDAQKNAEAIKQFVALDAPIGGYYGIPATGSKLPGVYRPLRYVTLLLGNPHPREMSRYLIDVIGQYLENLLQHLNLIGALGTISDKLFPMGRLVNWNRPFLPAALYTDLQWFASYIYNHAKHSIDFEDHPTPDAEHYFELDEALALCLIGRALGVQLKKLSGKTCEELMEKWERSIWFKTP